MSGDGKKRSTNDRDDKKSKSKKQREEDDGVVQKPGPKPVRATKGNQPLPKPLPPNSAKDAIRRAGKRIANQQKLLPTAEAYVRDNPRPMQTRIDAEHLRQMLLEKFGPDIDLSAVKDQLESLAHTAYGMRLMVTRLHGDRSLTDEELKHGAWDPKYHPEQAGLTEESKQRAVDWARKHSGIPTPAPKPLPLPSALPADLGVLDPEDDAATALPLPSTTPADQGDGEAAKAQSTEAKAEEDAKAEAGAPAQAKPEQPHENLAANQPSASPSSVRKRPLSPPPAPPPAPPPDPAQPSKSDPETVFFVPPITKKQKPAPAPAPASSAGTKRALPTKGDEKAPAPDKSEPEAQPSPSTSKKKKAATPTSKRGKAGANQTKGEKGKTRQSASKRGKTGASQTKGEKDKASKHADTSANGPLIETDDDDSDYRSESSESSEEEKETKPRKPAKSGDPSKTWKQAASSAPPSAMAEDMDREAARYTKANVKDVVAEGVPLVERHLREKFKRCTDADFAWLQPRLERLLTVAKESERCFLILFDEDRNTDNHEWLKAKLRGFRQDVDDGVLEEAIDWARSNWEIWRAKQDKEAKPTKGMLQLMQIREYRRDMAKWEADERERRKNRPDDTPAPKPVRPAFMPPDDEEDDASDDEDKDSGDDDEGDSDAQEEEDEEQREEDAKLKKFLVDDTPVVGDDDTLIIIPEVGVFAKSETMEQAIARALWSTKAALLDDPAVGKIKMLRAPADFAAVAEGLNNYAAHKQLAPEEEERVLQLLAPHPLRPRARARILLAQFINELQTLNELMTLLTPNIKITWFDAKKMLAPRKGFDCDLMVPVAFATHSLDEEIDQGVEAIQSVEQKLKDAIAQARRLRDGITDKDVKEAIQKRKLRENTREKALQDKGVLKAFRFFAEHQARMVNYANEAFAAPNKVEAMRERSAKRIAELNTEDDLKANQRLMDQWPEVKSGLPKGFRYRDLPEVTAEDPNISFQGLELLFLEGLPALASQPTKPSQRSDEETEGSAEVMLVVPSVGVFSPRDKGNARTAYDFWSTAFPDQYYIGDWITEIEETEDQEAMDLMRVLTEKRIPNFWADAAARLVAFVEDHGLKLIPVLEAATNDDLRPDAYPQMLLELYRLYMAKVIEAVRSKTAVEMDPPLPQLILPLQVSLPCPLLLGAS
jgi:hypothetical protein